MLAVDMAGVEPRLLRAAPDVQWAGPRMWGQVADDRAFLDLDTPEDLRRLRDRPEDVER